LVAVVQAADFGDCGDAPVLRRVTQAVPGTDLSITDKYADQIEYHAHGAMKQMELGNGVVEAYVYNKRLQLETITALKDPTFLFTLKNTYEPETCPGGRTHCNNGNVMNQDLWVPTNATQTTRLEQEFTYDGLNRLKTAEEMNGWLQTYVYGRYGNRAVLNTSYLPAGSLTPQVNSDLGSAVETIFPNNRISTGSYDDTGNLLAHGADGLSYDAENRQRERSKLYSGVTYSTEYSYDGEGRRVKKVEKANGAETAATVFVYDAGGQLAAEYGGSVVSDPLGCQRCFLTADHLGSTRMVTMEDGSGDPQAVNHIVARRYDHLPFGESLYAGTGARTEEMRYEVGPPVAEAVNARFTGQYRDAETGLDYFGARYNSGAMGRFTSADPLMASAKASSPQSWNRYAYVFNNPLRLVDPNGMEVPGECVNDPECTIVVKINAIYDTTANGGKGLKPKQKRRFENEQIARAKKDYGVSNIKLEVTYTDAAVTTDKYGNLFVEPRPGDGTLNVIAGTWTPTGEKGNSAVDPKADVALTFIDMKQAVDAPSFRYTSTTTHELGHQFLGHVYLPPPGFFEKLSKERQVDSRVRDQSSGTLQQDFREGLEDRRYAVPLNPDAHVPKK
jgi:RHS repeat-associated protein